MRDRHTENLIEQGLARLHQGRLIPIMRGASPETDSPFPEIPADIAALSDEDLAAFAEETAQVISEVAEAPQSFVSEALTAETLLAEMEESVTALEAVRAELASRAEDTDPEPDEDTDPAPTPEEPDAEALAARAAELAARAAEPEPVEVIVPAVVEPEPVVAAAVTPEPVVIQPRPARARRATPADSRPAVALTAAAGASDLPLGHEFGDRQDIAEAMARRLGQFGNIPDGVSGEKVTIARATWGDLYPEDRRLGRDENRNEALIAAAINPREIKAEIRRRLKAQENGDTLVASGGLCAPVTPYYQLQVIAQADRPVRAGLPSFNADRGGIRYARPASLSAITTGVGSVTAANDAAGGTFATKSCQVVACPPFQETDVEAIYHCLQFGNLGARTFPERVAQYNELTLAAHARLAESHLLTAIDVASTQVTAQALGLGATGSLLGQILAAANAMRSRHRMDPEAVLRLMLPEWAIDMMVSDVIRSQFQRFETDEDRITALLRSFDIEPSFYIDGAAGRGQVFGAQSAGALLPFPSTVVWYLFPEGSFLYLDGGVLELGLVRDSILNQTNDFQIFGETFEALAFVGVESLAVASAICDSGITAGTHNTPCPVDYTHTS